MGKVNLSFVIGPNGPGDATVKRDTVSLAIRESFATLGIRAHILRLLIGSPMNYS